MFPVDGLAWDAARLAKFDALVAPRGFPWKSIGKPVRASARDVEGFRQFIARHKAGLAIEAAAVKALR